MGWLGAAGLLLRRLRDEAALALLLAALVGATVFLFAAAPRAFNRLADDALREAARAATPAQRGITFVLTSTIAAGGPDGIGPLRAMGERFGAEIPPAVDALIGRRALRLTSLRFTVPDPPRYETRISLRYQDGVPAATTLVSGRWPVDRGFQLRAHDPFSEEEPEGPPPSPDWLEVAMSVAAADEIGVDVGDRILVESDPTDPGGRGYFFFGTEPALLEVTGLYEPLDPAAPDWVGDAGLIEAAQIGTVEVPVALVTAYIASESYRGLATGDLPFRYEWRFEVDPERLDDGQVEQLGLDLARLGQRGSGVGGDQPIVLTGLPGIVERHATERSLSFSVLSIAAIGPLGLAGGAIAMVTTLLVRRRTRDTALARGRGASGALVLGTQLWEGALLVGAATLVGLGLATSLVDARPTPVSAEIAVFVAVSTLTILALLSWRLARRSLITAERDEASVFRVSSRRLVVEGTIVVGAIAASLLLRQRGVLIDDESGTPSVDPLLASVPVLSGLAAGIVAVRLYPAPIRALAWLAARRPGIVAVFGLRTVGRSPAAANLPLLVLMLTVAFGSFSSVVGASLGGAQDDASYVEVGADFRIERGDRGALDPGLDVSGLPGVAAVAGAAADANALFGSTTRQRVSMYVQAIEPAAAARVTAGSAADAAWPAAFATTPGPGPGTPPNPIPAIVSSKLPAGSADLAPGATFRMTLQGHEATFVVSERRAEIPGLPRAIFVIVPIEWLRAGTGLQLPPSVLWVRATPDAADPLALAAAGAAGPTRVISRYDVLDELRAARFSAAVGAGFWVALTIAAAYMALTVVGAVTLSAERRSQDLAYLRALGFTVRQGLGITFMEHLPPVLLALGPGVALGIGVAVLCLPGLGLEVFADDRAIPVVVDWSAIGLLGSVLLVVVLAAVVVGTRLSARVRLADALRTADT